VHPTKITTSILHGQYVNTYNYNTSFYLLFFFYLWNIAEYDLPFVIHKKVMVEVLQCRLMVHCGRQVVGGAEGIHPLPLVLQLGL